jgi:sterol desaturase/sphingolipid hydroxylase (fatty acid hydroxylase superfamily)
VRVLSRLNLTSSFHKKHHQFKQPLTITTSYATPLENMLGSCHVFFSSLLLRSHPAVFIVYLIFVTWEAVEAHSGYELPFAFWVSLLRSCNPN